MKIMPNHDFFLILFATTLTPWLTWTRFMQISVTRNLKKVPIPHLMCTMKLLLSEIMMSGSS